MRKLTAQLAAAIALLGMVRSTMGAPADVFDSPAPPMGSDPPKGADLRDGDSSVSTQTGALQYSYPITVPPGRLGNEPKLSLSYSSQAATYGGIAAGWSLSIPTIELDTSEGTLVAYATDPNAAAGHWSSTMAGSRPLVLVDEPHSADVQATFRAQNDTSFTRYERLQGDTPAWRAFSPDGTTYYFGDRDLVGGTTFYDRAPLTRVVDTFGNTVEYRWTLDPQGAYYIDNILYSSNPGAGLPASSRVAFTWEAPPTCGGVPVGSAENYRAGRRILEGNKRLTRITVTAFDPATSATRHTREITLSYDRMAEQCGGAGHSPYRALSGIRESAWHDPTKKVLLPRVSFTYGDAARKTWVWQDYGSWWPDTDGHINTALSRGTRAKGESPQLHSFFLDVDGDGLTDHLRTGNASPSCTADWYRNTGTGFKPAGNIPLPTLPWSANDSPATKCALNGQETSFVNVQPGSGPCANQGSPNTTSLAYRWIDVTGDGLTDLVAAIHHDLEQFDPNLLLDLDGAPLDLFPYDENGQWTWPADDAGNCPEVASCVAVDDDCIAAALVYCTDPRNEQVACGIDDKVLDTCLGERVACHRGSLCTGDDCPDPGAPRPPPACDWPRLPQERCEAYPWLIYENLGNGEFATTPVVKYNPVPLESHENDSPAGKGNYGSTWHFVGDLDGDGVADAAILLGSPLTDPATWPDEQDFWWVFKGDGTGGFYGNGDRPFGWFVPRYARPGWSEWTNDPGSPEPPRITNLSTAGITDLNSDGLPDYYWRDEGASVVAVYWNLGHGFTWTPTYIGGGIDDVSQTYVVPNTGGWISDYMERGFSEQKTRFVDFDEDGRVDLFHSQQDPANGVWSLPTLMFNVGPNLLPGYPLSDAERIPMVQLAFASGADPDLFWDTRAEYIDIDGDGLSERVQLDGTTLQTMRHPVDGKPPRLLTRIDNGTGLHVDVTYAPLSDENVVTSAGAQIPTTQWVVSELDTTDDFESTPNKTRYRYIDPVWSPDDRGKYGFRGFAEVRTLNTRGAVVEERFGYDVDWSGRLVATLTIPVAGANDASEQPTSIVETAWQPYTLFGGEVETFHPRITRRYTCSNGQAEATCRNSPAAYAREETVWTAITPIGGTMPLLYAATRSFLQDGDWFDQGDRYTDTTSVLLSNTATYRLRTTNTVSKVLDGTVEAPYARSETIWDATYRFALEERSYSDATTYATTKRTYDSLTGNVVTVTKPEQFLQADQPRTTYLYDPQQLFVVETKNELGQIVNTVTDYGTGAVVRSIGPNAHSCNPSCGSNLGREESRTDIDGLGRTVATYVTRDASPGYALVKVSQASYVDTPPSVTTPTSMTTSSLIAYDASQWTQSTTSFDGHGRPIKIQTAANEGTATTTYDYDAEGKLVAVTLPDPSSTSTAVVTYTYAYDPLGRAKDLIRPDGTGVHSDYDGVTETRSEVTGTAGGPDAVTQTIYDAYGRLVRVREKTGDGSPPTFVDTTYGYDARDTVTQIVDPDTVTTDLIHDWGGRRTRIERRGSQTATRIWQYSYDRNGNLKTETSPVPTGALLSDYTTTYAYDDLDRVKSRLIAIRDVPKADRELLASEQVTYSYDTTADGKNRVGRVFEVKSFGPGATVPSLTKLFTYDAEGNVTEERLKYAIAGVAGERRIKSTYATGGKVRTVDYGDGTTTDAPATTSTFSYDLRANPSKLEFRQPSGPLYTAAQFTRNLAGVVTQRHKPSTSGPAQTANWSYDKLGRVIQQHVMASAPVATQTLTYWGSDDPKTLQHTGSGLPQRNYSFNYDDRHQLTSTTVSGSSFSSTYGFTSGGRLASANINAQAASGSDVRNRNVTYVYQSTDPEMLTSLRRTDGTTFASYNYDASGNLIARTQEGVTTSFLWDGDDQLRRATTGSQREEYYYDAGGTRLGIVKRAQSGSAWNVSQVRLFLGPLELSLSPTGSLTSTYAHLGTGTPVARVENRSTTEYQYHSTLQNLIATVAAGGQVRVHFAYGPYGEILQSTGGTESTHRRRFNDKYKDELTGLSYYGARYYDPVSMTWISADPAYRFTPDFASDVPRRANLYTFVGGNPLSLVDPDGRDWETVRDIGIRLLGGIECVFGTLEAGTGAGIIVATDGIGGVLGGGAMVFDGIDHQVHGCGTVVNGSSQPDRLLTQGINKVVNAAGGGKTARDWANAVADGGFLALGLSSAARTVLARQLEARVGGGGPKSARQLTDDELKQVVGGGRKNDTRQIDAICAEFNLNRTQREMLHREITGQGLTLDEIRLVAQDIALNNPTKGAQCVPTSADDAIGAPRKGQDPMTRGESVDRVLE